MHICERMYFHFDIDLTCCGHKAEENESNRRDKSSMNLVLSADSISETYVGFGMAIYAMHCQNVTFLFFLSTF